MGGVLLGDVNRRKLNREMFENCLSAKIVSLEISSHKVHVIQFPIIIIESEKIDHNFYANR